MWLKDKISAVIQAYREGPVLQADLFAAEYEREQAAQAQEDEQ